MLEFVQWEWNRERERETSWKRSQDLRDSLGEEICSCKWTCLFSIAFPSLTVSLVETRINFNERNITLNYSLGLFIDARTSQIQKMSKQNFLFLFFRIEGLWNWAWFMDHVKDGLIFVLPTEWAFVHLPFTCKLILKNGRFCH